MKSHAQIDLHNRNMDNKSIVYKVKTINPQQYNVQPQTTGIIGPGELVSVVIELKPLPNQEAVNTFLKSKQKFLIQYALIQQSISYDNNNDRKMFFTNLV